MKLYKPYKDIYETMYYLLLQVKDSLKFADNWLPDNIGNDTEYLYKLLKSCTKFHDDTKGEELIQSMQTLFEHNVHGKSGYGDCDCFVTTVTACCAVLNIPCMIVLAGRDKKEPVHIYNMVYDNGEWIPFDLTNNYYGEKRFYPFTQKINVI